MVWRETLPANKRRPWGVSSKSELASWPQSVFRKERSENQVGARPRLRKCRWANDECPKDGAARTCCGSRSEERSSSRLDTASQTTRSRESSTDQSEKKRVA
eukprot:6198457-Pleurochrysis_carterae.AAC.1